jgi:hypothetical protein
MERPDDISLADYFDLYRYINYTGYFISVGNADYDFFVSLAAVNRVHYY